MSDKRYCSRSELIDYLINNKNIDVNSLPSVVFEEKTYASLISPYTCLTATGIDSLTKKKTYDSPTDFGAFLECNIIDATISQCLYSYISVFEKRLRNFVIETLCSKLASIGDDECRDMTPIQNYLNGNPLFDFIMVDGSPSLDTRRIKANSISNQELKNTELNVIQDIHNKIISKRRSAFNTLLSSVDVNKVKKSSLDQHYIDSYGFIPLYIGMHSLTLGELLSIYSVFSLSDKNIFMRGYYRNPTHTYSDNDAYKFESRIKRINDIRNVIAHNEPIFPLIINDKRINSLASIFEKMKDNYNSALCKSPIVVTIPKFNAVIKNTYNNQCFDNIEIIIDSLNI